MTQPGEERSAESARRLLLAAVELIAEQGYRRTTVAEIAARAGYTRPMVRTRYGSKQALLVSILRSEYDSRLFATHDVADDAKGPELLLARVERLIELGEQLPELMQAFLVLSFEAVAPVPELRPWMRELLDRYLAEAARTLRSGPPERPIDDATTDTAARRFVAEGIGHAYLALTDPEHGDFVMRMREWRDALASDQEKA